MARKVHGGIVGGSGLGGLSANDTTLTASENDNISIDPTGTGLVELDGNTVLRATSELRFGDTDSSNYVAFKGAGTIGSDITWTLPATDGSSNQALITNGSGTLSWSDVGPVLTDNTTDSNTNYLVFGSSSSGNLTAARVATTKLSFQPSTGTLTSTNFVESSSITLKENISPIDNALESILNLVGVTYDRKDGSANGEAGLIAEDVNKVLPNLVTKDKDGNPLGITYTKLSAYLIEAVKSLKLEINEFKNKYGNIQKY